MYVFYSGYVQGVGFRYTIRRIGGQFDIRGWVKNLYDGRVELVAEAEEEVLKKTIKAINSAFEEYIKNAEIEWSEAVGEFDGFEIRF